MACASKPHVGKLDMSARKEQGGPVDKVDGNFPYYKLASLSEFTMPHIHQVATMTSKGQITLPKPIRQALGVDAGGRVAFDFNGQAITVSRAAPVEHYDPLVSRFLALLARDMEAGKNIVGLPAGLAQSLQQVSKMPIDLSAPIDGDVDL